MIKTKTAYLFEEMMKPSTEVDFDDVSDAIGYATVIFAVANKLGILFPSGNMQSREAIQTIRLAKEWIHNIDVRISNMTTGYAIELLEAYDFMQIVGNHKSISKAFEDDYIFKAFKARIHGDKSVNEYHLFLKISKKLERKEKPYFGGTLNWYSSSLTRWHKQFKNGIAIENLSDYDTLEIVSILLSENLFVFEGSKQGEFKKKLFENHRHYLDEIDDLGFEELSALSRFVSSASKYLQPEQYPKYTKAITAAQIVRLETNHFYRINLI